MAKYTDTGQKDAIYKYLKTRAEIKLWMLPEDKAKIQAAAEASRQSVNAFILDAVKAKIAAGGLDPGPQTTSQDHKIQTVSKNPDSQDT